MSGTIQWILALAVHPVKNNPIGSKIDPGTIKATPATLSSIHIHLYNAQNQMDVRNLNSGLLSPPFFRRKYMYILSINIELMRTPMVIPSASAM